MVEQLGMEIVDINASDTPVAYSMHVTIILKAGETGVDDCATVHNLIKTRMEAKLPSGKDLQLEVSTPGLQRVLHDAHEFSLFKGKRVRVFLPAGKVWLSGIILATEEKKVILTDCRTSDGQPMKSDDDSDDMEIFFDSIQKAKLEYIWEDRSHGN
ncbi:MAG: ribosome assembly cofactor RimP [Spirochaetia bacterium]|jgi:ribosome maturation factor RimP|nr:ribosome assembly cofactor RimP [Spirochaetia bacterium]